MTNKTHYQWAVIGAGPSGIAVVGKLLDAGVPEKSILWFDPDFQVGDFGLHWSSVPSNTKVSLFIKFLEASDAFAFDSTKTGEGLPSLDQDGTCELRYMAEPLQAISVRLCQRVVSVTSLVNKLSLRDNAWQLETADGAFAAKKVVLATGAEPVTLPLEGPSLIDINTAVDKTLLAKQVSKTDTVAVFGSSHSSILILRYLVELGCQSVINFYREPLRYAISMGDWTLYDDTGLKASTADWARDHIDGVWPQSLQRYRSTEENIKKHLPACDKMIQAVGFRPRELPIVTDVDTQKYDNKVGIIAPGLFGFGIGFPEMRINPAGINEQRVGLWKFMDYLSRVLPIWLRYPN